MDKKKRPLTKEDKVLLGAGAGAIGLTVAGLIDVFVRGDNSVWLNVIKFFYPKF